MMHSVVKGGWRPTFALAKQNDSEGRKSRIRRSKEERKAMVESFIKNYQESNGGNFPSLNLTHKEVGGSFYTVREIVRDIIQENRVLGPAKFNLEDFNVDKFLEQNPLGSIASGPQPFLDSSSNEHHRTHNKVPDTNGTMLSVSERHYTDAKHQEIDNGHAIDVGYVDVTNKESIEANVVSDECYTGAEHPVVDNGHVVNASQVDMTNNESVEAAVVSDGYFPAAELEIVDKEDNIEASQVDVTNKEYVEAVVVSDDHCTRADLEVVDKGNNIDGSEVDLINKESNDATIPENQVSKPVVPKENAEQELAATTVPLAKVNVLTKNLIVETFPLRSVARTSNRIEGSGELRDSDNSLEMDIKKLELEEDKKSALNDIKLTNNSNLLDDKFENALENKTLKEISNPRHDTESGNHSIQKEQVSASHQKAITLETNNQSRIEDTAKKNIQDEGLHEADKYRLDGQLGGNSQRRINATVDRINLESWDGRSKNSAKKEPNPLLALLKAIVNAFGKFLSE
ncbi:uncharacterized protein LOC123906982 [Trifolium pratense]|uniref:uncharacterized protein LOC123906982 n=1 Tax=Trifolium pratense TaxID=57577 RepID=UPI001E695F97|nr:uncharacterized protein LOC123906982 [Trifolium pratense]XP_045812994.1 uncharacterized protein LOC123906982 [Trifolium pratense]